MASLYLFKCRVSGSKAACWAFYGSTRASEGKNVIGTAEKDGKFELTFEGENKWGPDTGSKLDDETPPLKPENFPTDPNEAARFGEAYSDRKTESRSRILGTDVVLVWIDAYEPDKAYMEKYLSGKETFADFANLTDELRFPKYEDEINDYVSFTGNPAFDDYFE